MRPMTKDRLATIREREEKASKGPWKKELGFCGAERIPFLVRPGFDGVQFGRRPNDDNDMEFAAHARQDVPDLLDEVERLTRENERLQKDFAESVVRREN